MAMSVSRSHILSCIPLVTGLYTKIKKAAVAAIKDCSVKTVRTVPIGSRRTASFTEYTAQESLYDPEDITIIGGMALQLYEEGFATLEGTPLEAYVPKTSDMDLVWWPRRHPNVLLLSSPAVEDLVVQWIGHLHHSLSQADPDVRVERQDHIERGVISLLIYFRLQGYYIRLCEISIHDGGSSQLFNEKGEYQVRLQPMEMDPTYPIMINELEFNKDIVCVPDLECFAKQQLFAFGNMIRIPSEREKALICYKRVLYIEMILQRRFPSDVLIDVLCTMDGLYPLRLSAHLFQRRLETIQQFPMYILQAFALPPTESILVSLYQITQQFSRRT
jgi:hypothetical protein